MTRLFGMTLLPEMVAMWLIEFIAGFLIFLMLMHDSNLLPFNSEGSIHNAAIVNAFVLALTTGFVGLMIGLYRPETCAETRLLLLRTGVSATASLPAVWLVSKAAGIDIASALGDTLGWPLVLLLVWCMLLLVTRLVYTEALQRNLFVRRVVVLGESAKQTVESIAGTRRGLFRVEALLPQVDFDVARLPEGIWGVVYTGASAPTTLPAHIRAFEFKSFAEIQLGRMDVDAATQRDTASEFVSAARPHLIVDLTRRLMDVVFAVLLLLLTAPLLIITALLIRIESPGPVIYRQERIGLGGRSFVIWKFRSMRTDAERLGPTWASVKDNRVTAVGRFIRKVRIDELPQLVNILRGDMSLVGPRPERPHFVEQLAQLRPLYRDRCLVKPGLTGWAQVNYPYGASIEDAWEKLSYDLYYIKHQNLLFDLHILLATVRVILFQEGAR
jgi:lipopolysaccharide/colanic/teichoic acid biosynthesis glycosyltransferase